MLYPPSQIHALFLCASIPPATQLAERYQQRHSAPRRDPNDYKATSIVYDKEEQVSRCAVRGYNAVILLYLLDLFDLNSIRTSHTYLPTQARLARADVEVVNEVRSLIWRQFATNIESSPHRYRIIDLSFNARMSILVINALDYTLLLVWAGVFFLCCASA